MRCLVQGLIHGASRETGCKGYRVTQESSRYGQNIVFFWFSNLILHAENGISSIHSSICYSLEGANALELGCPRHLGDFAGLIVSE